MKKAKLFLAGAMILGVPAAFTIPAQADHRWEYNDRGPDWGDVPGLVRHRLREVRRPGERVFDISVLTAPNGMQYYRFRLDGPAGQRTVRIDQNGAFIRDFGREPPYRDRHDYYRNWRW